MALKKICQTALFIITMFIALSAHADANPFGQTIQINTNLQFIVGNPSWLLILRNEDTGAIVPYLYDIKNYDNFWIALSYARSYRIIASELQFQYAKIENFCHLEGGIIRNESYVVNLTGQLTPNRHEFQCHSLKFKNYSFPIAVS